jgi:anaerobic selenocysteine-containing dehydrogenase
MSVSRQPLNPDALRLEPAAGGLANYPPVEKWDDWVEYDTAQWPRKVEKRCQIIPTICFNCEAACDWWRRERHNQIRRFEGNPEHPGSRGRNCAKGPATLNQVTDPERIRYPLKRVGKRGEGKWERVSWDEVLDDIAGRVRKALQEERHNEIMYHVGRPGHELLYHQRILHSWGIDGHNAAHQRLLGRRARGYAFWSGIDRPSPDHANARFVTAHRTSKPATISTRTQKESSKAKSGAPRSA